MRTVVCRWLVATLIGVVSAFASATEPAGIREPEHLQPIAGAGLDPRIVGAAVQFGALGVGQMNSVHRRLPPTPYFLQPYSIVLLSRTTSHARRTKPSATDSSRHGTLKDPCVLFISEDLGYE